MKLLHKHCKGFLTLMNNASTQITFFSRIWHERKDLILGIIFIIITALYAILMVLDQVPLMGFAILGIIWIFLLILTGRLSSPTPIDFPILGFLLLLPVSLSISIDRGLSTPKILGLILSTALFYFIVNFVHNYSNLRLAIIATVILALGVAILGLAVADWQDSAFPIIPQLQTRLLIFLNIQSAPPELGSINVNTIGGALTFFIPHLASLIWDKGAYFRKYQKSKKIPHLRKNAFKLSLWAVFILIFVTLIATENRGAYLGAALGLLALAIWKDRRFTWLIPLIVVFFILGLFIFAEGNLLEFINLLDTDRYDTFATRFNLWQKVLAMVQDYPISGAGIGASARLYEDFYIFNIFSGTNDTPVFAHNTLLSVAIDLGIPGLVLYSSLLSAFIAMVINTYKYGRSINRVLLSGLTCGFFAHHIFGLMDAYTLGAKMSIIQWIFLGLITAIFIHKDSFRGRASHPQSQETSWEGIKLWLRNFFLELILWVLISLAAVAFINLSPILSIFLAIAGGVVLGIFSVKCFRGTSLSLR